MIVHGRLIACVRCGNQWDVIEAPVQHVKPSLYHCPDCRRPVQGQMGMSDEARVDRIGYMPEMSEVGY